MDTRLHLLESFQARGSDGRTYKVCGYERMARDESIPAREHWEPTGLAEYRLDDGTPIEAHGDGSMSLKRGGVRLERCS